MECPRCHAQIPETAHFCSSCGDDRRGSDAGRRRSFAARPDEPVASFALVSSIMPRGSGQRPQTYRIALTIALVVALVAAIFGAMPIAVLVAAFAVPIVYIVYMYDVNLWEDEPIPVTGLAFALTGVLAILWTVLWTWLRGPVSFSTPGLEGSGSGAPDLGTFLVVALLAPVVGEAIRQVGPVLLASRPQFDDLMDGLTFGVISGVAYATFDTLVRHWSLLTGGVQSADPGLWVSLVFLEGFVKPLLMGTATGLACAEFSGLGRGYDGFTPRYLRAVVLAVVANVAYSAGVYLFSFLGSATLGVLLSIVWGLLILGILILRLRVVLHTGLMEAALEHAARTAGVGPDGELEFCAQCEMPLQPGSAFCAACGTAVSATSNGVRVRPRVPAGATAGGSGEETVTVQRGGAAAPTDPTGSAASPQGFGRDDGSAAGPEDRTTRHDGEEQA